MNEQLKKDFAKAIVTMSLYNAAEGQMWFQEERQRDEAQKNLKILYKEMVSVYGKDETIQLVNSIPNLIGKSDLE